ncbi:hypothetical protein PAXINDRAFT_103389 [Paxillus involutus ATCC 200175]|uniref:Uncharacterized protein n=1 Tax=Paxillus involutus ATCC 200175 TaxID=664439 RepID=A0A0C9TGG2_PAXIN|nr:hypothetical protein PAXINDRAFT_103389 [Paxillus involutus ATCC 200175]
MAHSCVDWTTTPPTRKTPLLILSWGSDSVYTVVPAEFKTLEEVAREEFGFGNVEIEFSSSCINLCNGIPARISESVWEHITPYIGCISVAVRGLPSRGQSTTERLAEKRQAVPEPANAEPKLVTQENNADDHDGNPPEHGHDDSQSIPIKETVTEEEDSSGDHVDGGTTAPEYDSHEEPEEAWEEEVSAIPLPKLRRRHRVVSEDEDEDEGFGKPPEVLPKLKAEKSVQDHASDTEKQSSRIKSPTPPLASPPKPPQPLSREIKKERDPVDYSQSPGPPRPETKPIKQEKRDSESRTPIYERNSQPTHTQSQSQSQSQTETQGDPCDHHRLMIRVAHRASKQESKFTAKSSTKVAKLIAGACKSFGLDATRATLYLIVAMEDEDGVVENLFPCDKRDTMVRAGAEQDAESKFLLKIAGDP